MRMLRVALPLLLSLSGCSSALCSDETITSVRSPDGKHLAILFMKECGATTDYTTQVSVVSSAWPFHDVGNAFVADAYDDEAKRGEWRGPWAEVAWVSPQRLLITYDERSRVFTQNSRVRDVEIIYRAVRP